MLSSTAQFLNADLPIDVTESDILTLFKSVQSAKANSPIVSTPDGITISVIFVE